MSALYSIGAMNQLADTLENSDWTADDITKLKQFGNLKGIKDILYGKAEIKYPEHLIDCDAAPFVPPGMTVEKHVKGGFWKFNPKKILLYLSRKQKKELISGNDLQKDLEGKPVLNANVLDWLLAHPEFIPENWKGKLIFFWGTIYRSSGGSLCVRYLGWDGTRWDWDYNYLDYNFNSSNPAALAS